MQAKLVKIGNSREVRLPKVLIEEACLGDEIDVMVEGRAVILRSVDEPRRGWVEDAKACHESGDDRLADWDTALTDGDWR